MSVSNIFLVVNSITLYRQFVVMIIKLRMSGCSLWVKRFYRESLILVLCSFILVHLLLDHPEKFDEVTTLKNINVALPSFLQQNHESAPKPEPAVKSLREISDDLATISDDDPKLLNYLRTQKITYPDYSVDRHIGEPELGQVSMAIVNCVLNLRIVML